MSKPFPKLSRLGIVASDYVDKYLFEPMSGRLNRNLVYTGVPFRDPERKNRLKRAVVEAELAELKDIIEEILHEDAPPKSSTFWRLDLFLKNCCSELMSLQWSGWDNTGGVMHHLVSLPKNQRKKLIMERIQAQGFDMFSILRNNNGDSALLYMVKQMANKRHFHSGFVRCMFECDPFALTYPNRGNKYPTPLLLLAATDINCLFHVYTQWNVFSPTGRMYYQEHPKWVLKQVYPDVEKPKYARRRLGKIYWHLDNMFCRVKMSKTRLTPVAKRTEPKPEPEFDSEPDSEPESLSYPSPKQARFTLTEDEAPNSAVDSFKTPTRATVCTAVQTEPLETTPTPKATASLAVQTEPLETTPAPKATASLAVQTEPLETNPVSDKILPGKTRSQMNQLKKLLNNADY